MSRFSCRCGDAVLSVQIAIHALRGVTFEEKQRVVDGGYLRGKFAQTGHERRVVALGL